MGIDLTLASRFMTSHARVLDRRRFEVLTTGTGQDAVIRGLDAYRNPDGGYGWGLEPDLRAAESQPAGALHALEALVTAAPATSPHTVPLLDWLQSVTLPDGGLPFASPITDPTGCAPFWVDSAQAVQAGHPESSLQITAAVAAQAHLLARTDATVRDHPWLATATRYCLDAVTTITGSASPPFAYVLSFSLRFLDAACDSGAADGRVTADLLRDMARFVPVDGAVPVEGGAEGETLRLLDFAPVPGRPVRELLDVRAVVADLDRLEQAQCADGGWPVDFTSYSASASLEWRGHATVHAVEVLRANGRTERSQVPDSERG
ncbi:hypothetical protein [Corynebacterium kalidii]|uniref:Prenyltransferase n=1 Tax=Corynebacterium kalidii TaxID=2931982 RepID=A0A9X2AZ89_9CORY|nr:hypothetical protein [Corynebacterium kalidii]MCJ7858866.1 hypothetical protein [Corynebacterium kalidii]